MMTFTYRHREGQDFIILSTSARFYTAQSHDFRIYDWHGRDRVQGFLKETDAHGPVAGMGFYSSTLANTEAMGARNREGTECGIE